MNARHSTVVTVSGDRTLDISAYRENAPNTWSYRAAEAGRSPPCAVAVAQCSLTPATASTQASTLPPLLCIVIHTKASACLLSRVGGHSYALVMGRRVDLDDLADAHDIAALIGLSHANHVHLYQQRYPDMPKPVLDRGGRRAKLWLRSEVKAWVERRTAAPRRGQ